MATSDSMTLRVVNWRAYGRSISLSLDKRLFPDRESLATYCERRYGDGRLVEAEDGTWEYRIEASAPSELLKAFFGLLGRSHN